jgi:hypothetical protein
VAYLAHWVLALPLVLPYLAVRWRSVSWKVGAGALALAGLCLWQAGRLQWWYAALLAALSAMVLVDVVVDGYRRRDPLQLILGGWLWLPVLICPYVHLPSKYLLISAPAMAVVLVRVSRGASLRLRPILWSTTALAGLALGLAIVRADLALAESGRRAAAELIAPQVAAGLRVWYFGHWGFQWYAEQAGARPVLPRAPFPEPGDLLVGTGGGGHPWLKRYARVAVQRLASPKGAGGRIMDGRLGVGFYSDAWGYLPWTWSRQSLPEYVVWRVVEPTGP